MARKRGMQYIPYDYEAAYNKAMEDMHEWFIENLFQHRKKVIYALKEITAGDGILRDIVQCQRTGAAGERAGGDTSGSDAESGDNDTNSREHATYKTLCEMIVYLNINDMENGIVKVVY